MARQKRLPEEHHTEHVILSLDVDAQPPEWVATCKLFDLVGTDYSKEDALMQLIEAICLQAKASREHNNWDNLLSPEKQE